MNVNKKNVFVQALWIPRDWNGDARWNFEIELIIMDIPSCLWQNILYHISFISVGDSPHYLMHILKIWCSFLILMRGCMEFECSVKTFSVQNGRPEFSHPPVGGYCVGDGLMVQLAIGFSTNFPHCLCSFLCSFERKGFRIQYCISKCDWRNYAIWVLNFSLIVWTFLRLNTHVFFWESVCVVKIFFQIMGDVCLDTWL